MENNGGYNMKKKLILPILAISLAVYAPVTNAYASYSNNDLILSTANNTASKKLLIAVSYFMKLDMYLIISHFMPITHYVILVLAV